MHEDNQILHEIPPVPIDIQTKFLEENESFLRSCIREGLLEYETLSEKEKEMVKQHSTLFTLEDGCVYLNPFGQFLFNRAEYRAKLQTKIYFSQDVMDLLDRQRNQRSFVFQQCFNLLKKLKEDEVGNRGELYHERDFSVLNRNQLQFHLYKGASNGGLFRATWKYDKETDYLYINYIWLSKPYETDVLNGVGFSDKQTKYFDVSQEVYGK